MNITDIEVITSIDPKVQSQVVIGGHTKNEDIFLALSEERCLEIIEFSLRIPGLGSKAKVLIDNFSKRA